MGVICGRFIHQLAALLMTDIGPGILDDDAEIALHFIEDSNCQDMVYWVKARLPVLEIASDLRNQKPSVEHCRHRIGMKKVAV